MNRYKNRKTGEQHIVPASQREAYPADDWALEEENVRVSDKLDPEQERKAGIRALDPVERFDILMTEIEKLRARIEKLES